MNKFLIQVSVFGRDGITIIGVYAETKAEALANAFKAIPTLAEFWDGMTLRVSPVLV